MPDLSNALELMHFAHEKAETIRAEVRIRRHRALAHLAWERWQASQDSERSTAPVFASDETASTQEAAFAEDRYQVWTQRPGWRWRIERLAGTGMRLTVLNGNHFWIDAGSDHELYTNEHVSRPTEGRDPDQLIADMFDPSAPLTLFRLTYEGEDTLLGRPAHRLRGHPKHHGEADDYRRSWYYADAHVLWVDAEFGVLLRYRAYLGDELMAETELKSVVFNEAIDPGMFVG
jgi:outer membrane lipoprotein-sorting protein